MVVNTYCETAFEHFDSAERQLKEAKEFFNNYVSEDNKFLNEMMSLLNINVPPYCNYSFEAKRGKILAVMRNEILKIK